MPPALVALSGSPGACADHGWRGLGRVGHVVSLLARLPRTGRDGGGGVRSFPVGGTAAAAGQIRGTHE